MINHFLATLDNNPVAPVGFVWPEFDARTITGTEASCRGALIGLNLSREARFSRCLQLLNLVHESPLVGYVTAADPRITYDKQAIQARFQASGTIVQYTGYNGSPGLLNLVLTGSTPAISAYTVTIVDATHATILDDLGNSVTRTFSYSGGITSQIAVPNSDAFICIANGAPASGDSWSVNHQAAGVSWVSVALGRVDTLSPRSIMTPDLVRWHDRSLLPLDRLAAIVAALGTQA